MKTVNLQDKSVKMFHVLAAFILLLFGIAGCGGGGGGGGSNTEDNNTAGTGKFIDAAVQGLKYVTGSTEAYTDENGSFQYEINEKIQFFIGDIELGMKVSGKDMISPLDLVENGDLENDEVINIARFLQSLDSDKTDDIITIPLSVHEKALNETLLFSSSFFDDDAVDVIKALTYGNDDYSSVPNLVSRADAIAHLEKAIAVYNGTWSDGDSTDDGVVDDDTDDDDDIEWGEDSDDGYGDISPFTESEVVGTYNASITLISSTNPIVLVYHFGEDNTGTLVYPSIYPAPCQEPELEWILTSDGRIKYIEYCGNAAEVTYITRYTNGDVLWTNAEGTIGFVAEFTKTADSSDDVAQFLGTWSAEDQNPGDKKSSIGAFVVSESDGAYTATGEWVASVTGTVLGTVTVSMSFSDALVSFDDGVMGFSATGTASESTGIYGTTKCTLEVLDATTTSCTYRINFESETWRDTWETLMGSVASEDWVYIGTASVTISN